MESYKYEFTDVEKIETIEELKTREITKKECLSFLSKNPYRFTWSNNQKDYHIYMCNLADRNKWR